MHKTEQASYKIKPAFLSRLSSNTLSTEVRTRNVDSKDNQNTILQNNKIIV